MDWIFSGIGTQIISSLFSLIVGAIGGGVIGYKIGMKHSADQRQAASDSAKQRQEFQTDVKSKIGNESSNHQVSIRQRQKAGSNANQTQIGGIKDDRR